MSAIVTGLRVSFTYSFFSTFRSPEASTSLITSPHLSDRYTHTDKNSATEIVSTCGSSIGAFSTGVGSVGLTSAFCTDFLALLAGVAALVIF